MEMIILTIMAVPIIIAFIIIFTYQMFREETHNNELEGINKETFLQAERSRELKEALIELNRISKLEVDEDLSSFKEFHEQVKIINKIKEEINDNR
jgi:hypothetical protein